VRHLIKKKLFSNFVFFFLYHIHINESNFDDSATFPVIQIYFYFPNIFYHWYFASIRLSCIFSNSIEV